MCTTVRIIDTDGKWKKSSIRKVSIILFGDLWVVKLIYRLMFSFKFTLKGLSYEIDFENVDENLQILALTRAAAGF